MSKKQSETNVWKGLQLDLCQLGFRLFRNQRYKGKTDKGVWIDCGVGGDGGADLVGYRIVTITPDMVGKTFAQYAEVEAKTKTGVASGDQKIRIEALNKNGAIALVARSVEDVKKYLSLD